jgi:hypothetical protein
MSEQPLQNPQKPSPKHRRADWPRGPENPRERVSLFVSSPAKKNH